VCSYPKFTPVPFREESLWDGYPEETNAPYGIAKKAMLIHAQANESQYGQQFACVIPTNLYGPGDHFHPSVSHVIPALIKKCVEAKENGDSSVSVWGTGTASRDYLYVVDAAQAIVLAAQTRNSAEPLNLGNNNKLSEDQVAAIFAEIAEQSRIIVVNTAVPRGWRDDNNALIAKYAAQYGARLIDWASISAGQSRILWARWSSLGASRCACICGCNCCRTFSYT